MSEPGDSDDPLAPLPPVTVSDDNAPPGPSFPALDPSTLPAPDPAPVPVPAPVPAPDPAAYFTPPPDPPLPPPSVPDPDDDDPDAPRARPAAARRRRTVAVAAAAIFLGLIIAALIFLGRANASRYLIACSSDRITAERGRSFPPWGSVTLGGPEWRAIPLPPNAECKPRETDDDAELAHWYLDALIDRASAILTTRDLLDSLARPPAAGKTAPPVENPLDVASTLLDQALLLARAPERRDERKEVERLQGDVVYWRASTRLRDAQAALGEAAKQFDDAAARRPRHVSDASAWATFVRRLSDELHAGPNGLPASTPPVGAPPTAAPHAPAPPGTALPVEPPPEPVPPPAIDAGVPAGGVLL